MPARIVRIQQHQEVWLTKRSRVHLHPQRCVEYRTAQPVYDIEESEEEQAREGLMLVRRHRQNLDDAIGEFDQLIGMICQPEILLDRPEALKRAKSDLLPIVVAHKSDLILVYVCRHDCPPLPLVADWGCRLAYMPASLRPSSRIWATAFCERVSV